jgi:hypothetical protein
MRILLLILLAMPVGATEAAALARDLDEIARVATAMVDGDACQRIVTDRAAGYMLRTDPRDEFAAGDNYDVNDKYFIQTKKTLMRLALLVDYPVDVNLWMPVPAHASQIHVVIRNRYEMSQFWVWGALTQDMFPQMRSVLESGKRLTVKQKPGFVSVLAPVRNSMGKIVGLVEAVARVTPDARENVK